MVWAGWGRLTQTSFLTRNLKKNRCLKYLSCVVYVSHFFVYCCKKKYCIKQVSIRSWTKTDANHFMVRSEKNKLFMKLKQEKKTLEPATTWNVADTTQFYHYYKKSVRLEKNDKTGYVERSSLIYLWWSCWLDKSVYSIRLLN